MLPVLLNATDPDQLWSTLNYTLLSLPSVGVLNQTYWSRRGRPAAARQRASGTTNTTLQQSDAAVLSEQRGLGFAVSVFHVHGDRTVTA